MSMSELLWLGCGDCQGLKYFPFEFKKMLLIDARSLDELTIPEPLVGSFKQLVVSSDHRLSTFKETNIPELSALDIADCFKTDYPGLEVEQERETYTTSIFDIVQGFFKNKDAKKTLILDIPGFQVNLLDTLKNENALQGIDEIIVWDVPQGAGTVDTGISVTQYLKDNGFVSFSRGERFNGYKWVHFFRNPLFFDYTELRQKFSELENKLIEETRSNLELQEKYELLKRTGIRLESQIEIIQKLISFDSQ